jgi:hypothetical protein
MVSFSLMRGGLMHRLMRRAGLVRYDGHDLKRQILALIAITWLPLLLLGLLRRAVYGPGASFLFLDLSVHARFLVAVPLLLIAEYELNVLGKQAVTRFCDELTRDEDRDVVAMLVRRAERWRDLPLAEALIAGLAFVAPTLVWVASGHALVHGQSNPEGMSMARLYFHLASLPVFNFLMFHLLWRWLIWCKLLWDFSRLQLRLMPTHPDLAAGLGMLLRPSMAFVVVLTASSVVLAAAWGSQVLFGGVRATEFAAPLLALVLVGELLALGPLLLFMVQLRKARIDGLHHYGALALDYARRFDDRWIEHGPPGPELLGSPDIQSLADMQNSHAIVEKMRLAPFGARAISHVALAMMVPMLPLFASEAPVAEMVKRAGKLLLAG